MDKEITITDTVKAFKEVLVKFTLEFVQAPYLCYTEHGLHARFYSQLYNDLSEEQLYFFLDGKKVCVIQKEYPTATNLGRSKRQHRDISMIKKPAGSSKSIPDQSYDFFKLSAVVEFGMNASVDHLEDDIDRLCHPDANVESRFLVHLYRLGKPGNRFCRRDLSNRSRSMISIKDAALLTIDKPVEIFYGIYDNANIESSGVWHLQNGSINKL